MSSATVKPPLRRPTTGRVLGGVAAGLADSWGVKRSRVRWVFAGFGVFLVGLVLYLWLWLTVPSADAAAPPPALARLAPRLRDPVRSRPATRLVAGLALLGVAALLAVALAGSPTLLRGILPALILGGAVWLAWSQLDKADPGTRRGPVSWLRLAAALTLVVVAATLLVSRGGEPESVVAALMAGLVALAAVALVLAPWALRLINALADQRAATAREAERADITAHLHDSVLQTLAVIRSRADDPGTVRRLARAQERELREWLYRDRSEPGVSVAAALRAVAGEVEDITGVEVGVVLVGDQRPSTALDALVGATREALLNAARHGAPPVSLYAELSPAAAQVFVRDKGRGFDLGAVPPDRLGVRESILGRVRRQGGHAEIRSTPGRGTEICLRQRLAPAAGPAARQPVAVAEDGAPAGGGTPVARAEPDSQAAAAKDGGPPRAVVPSLAPPGGAVPLDGGSAAGRPQWKDVT
ncbi:MAG: PspC domain-containing protein [Bifidobacteriaceae bacterium]|jgi:signal transduction histidine kinase|nr:PspC domain-containing protein [Bifidobacteriaceae bacterium]